MCEQGKMKSIQLLLETKVCFQPLRFNEQQYKTKVSLRSRRNRSRGKVLAEELLSCTENGEEAEAPDLFTHLHSHAQKPIPPVTHAKPK